LIFVIFSSFYSTFLYHKCGIQCGCIWKSRSINPNHDISGTWWGLPLPWGPSPLRDWWAKLPMPESSTRYSGYIMCKSKVPMGYRYGGFLK
jgi:hypothetical protein